MKHVARTKGKATVPSVRVEVTDAATGRVLNSSATIEYADRTELSVGRHGDLPIGVSPDDPGLSRFALVVRADDAGWTIVSQNANGAILCPWGQPTLWCERATATVVRWPLLAVRVLGTRPDLHHWVLLENLRFVVSRRSTTPSSTTSLSVPPAPLTGPQQEAVAVVFDQYLAWPPVASPHPVPLQAAARRLHVSHAAVYQRLEAARARAYGLGAQPQIGVSDPAFVFALVRAGYIQPDVNADESVARAQETS